MDVRIGSRAVGLFLALPVWGTGGPLRRWLVIDADGAPQGHVEVPRDWEIRWVSADAFVVVEKDEVDVPWVLRLRLGS